MRGVWILENRLAILGYAGLAGEYARNLFGDGGQQVGLSAGETE